MSAGRVLASTGLSFAFMTAFAVMPNSRGPDEPTMAMTCFAIAGSLTCIEAGYVPVAPTGPSVMVPLGPAFDGESEEIVIRDDGGNQVARG